MNWYKQSQFDVNSKKELAYELLEWHGGQGSPLYSVGSSWTTDQEVSSETIEWAVQELESNIHGQDAYPVSERQKNIFTLRSLIGRLEDELGQQKAHEQSDMEGEQASYEAEMGRDTHKNYGDGYSVEDTSIG
jgi:hypothetical protein